MSASDTPNPVAGLPDPPAISMQTIAITGILVDIYGLDGTCFEESKLYPFPSCPALET